jgi:hypothetical protein
LPKGAEWTLDRGSPSGEAGHSRNRGIDMKPVLALLASTALAAGPATMAKTPPQPQPEAGAQAERPVTKVRPIASRVRTLIVTVASGERAQPPDRYGVLNCEPVGGSHPSPAAACAALGKVQGDPARLRENPDMACPMVFSPITVTANGIWDGKYLSYQRTYGNDCQMRSTMGTLFDI